MVIAVLIALFACVPKTAPLPSAVPESACPDPIRSSPPACGAINPRGDRAELPLEWGMAAAGNALWGGRLYCGSGAMAEVKRMGNVGAVKTERSGVHNPGVPDFAEQGMDDIIDEWMVFCPGEDPRVLYTNLYRCGDLCLPSGVRVRSAEDHVLLGQAIEDRDHGKEVSAARMLSAYTARLPDDELARHIQMETAMRMGDMETASQAASAALRIAPSRMTNKVHSALTHLMAGHREEAWAMQKTLAAESPTPQDPGWPAARCVESLLLGADGRRQEAQVAGKEACDAGFDLCCPDEPPLVPG